MKHPALLPWLLLFSPAALANWTLSSFPPFSESPCGIFTSSAEMKKGQYPLQLYQDGNCWQPGGVVKLNQPLSLQPCAGEPAALAG